MSLINQMLRDLDARRDDQGPAGEVHAVGHGGSGRSGHGQRWLLQSLVAALLVAMVVAALMAWQIWSPAPDESPTTSVALPLEPLETGESDAAASPEPGSGSGSESAMAEQEAAAEPTRLTELQLLQTREGSRLRLDFDGSVDYRRRSAADNALRLELDAEFPQALLDMPPPGVADITVEGDSAPRTLSIELEEGWEAGPLYLEEGLNGAERLLLNLRPTAIAERFAADDPASDAESAAPAREAREAREARAEESRAEETRQAGSRDDQLEEAAPDGSTGDFEIFSRTEAVARAVGTEADARMVRERSGPSQTEQAEAAWQSADAALDAGNWQAAESSLREALALDPSHLDARASLAELLHHQQGAEAADEWLAGALEVDGLRAEEIGYLARQRARMWLDEAQRERAIQALEPVYPRLDDSSRTGALLAGLLYQAGRHESAARLYEGLVRQSPREGAWWMGLGLAREGLSDPSGAREAYQNALAGDGLRSTVRDYLRDRIAELESGR